MLFQWDTNPLGLQDAPNDHSSHKAIEGRGKMEE